MFKVICINDKSPYAAPVAPWKIKEGEVYTVTNTGYTKWGIVYELNIQPGVGYWPEFFVPLSEIDETEMERNYKTEKV